MRPFTRTNTLKSVASLRAPQPQNPTQSIDARIIKTGFDPNTCRSNFKVLHFFEQGSVSKARQVFDDIPNKNTVSTNMMISGYVKARDLVTARELFDKMVERSAVSWTIMIGGYVQGNQFCEAFRIFVQMRRSGVVPDHVTFATLLSGFNDRNVVVGVRQIHGTLVKLGYESSVIVCNSLIDSYCKGNCLDLGCELFKRMPVKDPVSFNSLITGFAKDGLYDDAVKLFLTMLCYGFKPSDFTFAAVLCAGIGLDDMVFGQQIHGFVVKTSFVGNVFVANALLDFYSKSDCVGDARRVFDEMLDVDGVSYNVMVTGYARNGQLEESFGLFRELQFTRFDRRQFPYATMLSVAANTLSLEMGRQIHGQTIATTAVSEALVGNSLVDMYAKCGRFEEAKNVFANLALKNTVPWTAIISSYIQNGLYEDSLKLFKEMLAASISPDQATFACILKAAANIASISLGKQLHSCVIRSGFMSHVHSGCALLDVYAKCGSMKDAIHTFHEMPERNNITWNALISAFAQNGDGEATMKAFDDMLHSGFQPDSISFLSVLTSCSHCGLVKEGLEYFNSMSQKYKLVPKKEHYASVVDMLCRSARFDEAEKIIAEMPFEPDEIMWSSVLNSCRIHKNQELGKKAADQLFKMDQLRDAAAYVSMSNIYAAAGQWDNVGKVKLAMRERGVKKLPAYSWVEIKKKIHVFSSNDKSHPQMENILEKIDMLGEEMEKEGYKPDTSCALHNVDDKLKAESLKHHSERLAIAFALINAPEGSPILVMKNLRACTDCHAAIKMISKIVKREITVRDSNRFHHFKDGICSCGDYW